MSEKIIKVRDFCDHCDGEGNVSECCEGYIDEHRCGSCGRFCSVNLCHNCNGEGHTDYHIGDEVDVFVCVWSEDYLQDQLHKTKDPDDSKTFTGKIIEFVDKWNAVVLIGKKKISVKIEDISFR